MTELRVRLKTKEDTEGRQIGHIKTAKIEDMQVSRDAYIEVEIKRDWEL